MLAQGRVGIAPSVTQRKAARLLRYNGPSRSRGPCGGRKRHHYAGGGGIKQVMARSSVATSESALISLRRRERGRWSHGPFRPQWRFSAQLHSPGCSPSPLAAPLPPTTLGLHLLEPHCQVVLGEPSFAGGVLGSSGSHAQLQALCLRGLPWREEGTGEGRRVRGCPPRSLRVLQPPREQAQGPLVQRCYAGQNQLPSQSGFSRPESHTHPDSISSHLCAPSQSAKEPLLCHRTGSQRGA